MLLNPEAYLALSPNRHAPHVPRGPAGNQPKLQKTMQKTVETLVLLKLRRQRPGLFGKHNRLSFPEVSDFSLQDLFEDILKRSVKRAPTLPEIEVIARWAAELQGREIALEVLPHFAQEALTLADQVDPSHHGIGPVTVSQLMLTSRYDKLKHENLHHVSNDLHPFLCGDGSTMHLIDLSVSERPSELALIRSLLHLQLGAEEHGARMHYETLLVHRPRMKEARALPLKALMIPAEQRTETSEELLRSGVPVPLNEIGDLDNQVLHPVLALHIINGTTKELARELDERENPVKRSHMNYLYDIKERAIGSLLLGGLLKIVDTEHQAGALSMLVSGDSPLGRKYFHARRSTHAHLFALPGIMRPEIVEGSAQRRFKDASTIQQFFNVDQAIAVLMEYNTQVRAS